VMLWTGSCRCLNSRFYVIGPATEKTRRPYIGAALRLLLRLKYSALRGTKEQYHSDINICRYVIHHMNH